MRAVTAERALLAELQGGCRLPLGAWARIEDGDDDPGCLRAFCRRRRNPSAVAAKSSARPRRTPNPGQSGSRRTPGCGRRPDFFAWQEGPLDNRDKTEAALPLAGKRIVVTRAPEQAGELVRALESWGAKVLLLPTVSFAPPEDLPSLDAALARLHRFRLDSVHQPECGTILLSSPARFRTRASGAWRSLRARIAAVGSATAQAAAAEGISRGLRRTNSNGRIARARAARFHGRKESPPAAQRPRG